MPTERIDWTFDEAPVAAAEPQFDGPALPPPNNNAPRRPPRPLPRWLIPATILIALVVVLGGYIFQRLGWARIEAQLQAEVALEDRYVRAGEVQLVLNLLAHDNDVWLRVRLGEAASGLPAPLPAPHLLPLPDEPRVLKVDTLGGNLFNVTVLRRYADAAGRAFEFEQVATYRNLGPGLWQHVAPLVDGSRIATFTGSRLTASYPVVDVDWLKTALPLVEANLVRACADWGCPPDVVVPLTFYADPRTVRPPVEWDVTATSPIDYPLIFALEPQSPTYPASLRLPALALAGRPHDAPAAEALVRALTVRGLAFVAAAISRSDRTSGDYFLDALVARAEQRLGLAAPLPPGLLPPTAAWPPGLLWNPTPGDFLGDMRGERPQRVLALQFLNAALAGQPPSVDGQLLRGLRQRGAAGVTGLGPWLTATLGREATEAGYARWTTVLAAQAINPVGASLGVLLFTCNDGAWLLNDGADAVILPGAAFTSPQAGATALSPDGRYFAYIDNFSQLMMHVLDLETGEDSQVAIDPGIQIAGWTAHNQLLYVNGLGSHLWRYFPRAHFAQELLARPVSVWQDGWSRDRLSLLLVQFEDGLSYSQPELVQVSIGGGAIVTPVAPDVTLFAFSPGNGLLAYLIPHRAVNGVKPWSLELMDLATGDNQTLLTSEEATAQLAELPFELQPGEQAGPIELSALAWSPDGLRLNITLRSERALYLFTLATDQPAALQLVSSSNVGLLWSGGFSADSRYLAFQSVNLEEAAAGNFNIVLSVMDLTTGAQQIQNLPGSVNDGAWSPTGHTLAIAGTEGVFLKDVTTGAQTQIATQSCGGVQWYASPSPPNAGD